MLPAKLFRVDVSFHVLGRGKNDDGVMKVGGSGTRMWDG